LPKQLEKINNTAVRGCTFGRLTLQEKVIGGQENIRAASLPDLSNELFWDGAFHLHVW